MTRWRQQSMLRRISILFFEMCMLAACDTPVASSTLTLVPTNPPLVSPTQAQIPLKTIPVSTPTELPTEPITRTPVEPTVTTVAAPGFCSPLAGYTLEELPEIVSNPYQPPAPGSDNPHQGVDLADRMGGSGMAVVGMPVQAILAGKVVLAQTDRFPYGSAVMVETSLQMLPDEIRTKLPEAGPLWTPNPALTCPEVSQPQAANPERSVYVLYAHMHEAPLVQPGEIVSCEQVMGEVGQSGNALAPHLHLEIRLGPAGWQPVSLAHYTSSATQEEMGQYCLWRVSGVFQHLDPLQWLAESSTP